MPNDEDGMNFRPTICDGTGDLPVDYIYVENTFQEYGADSRLIVVSIRIN